MTLLKLGDRPDTQALHPFANLSSCTSSFTLSLTRLIASVCSLSFVTASVMPSLAEELKSVQSQFESALERGSSSADAYEKRIKELRKQIKKEKYEIKPHPA